jgi:nucleoside-diphosphate-sugar epimerase
MKILITGVNGSLGYHLVEELKENNELYLLDLNFNRLNHLKEQDNIHFLNTNILDKDQRLNLDFELDIIIHLASKYILKLKMKKKKENSFRLIQKQQNIYINWL